MTNDRDRRPPPDVERYEAPYDEHPSMFAHLDALDEAGDPFDDPDSGAAEEAPVERDAEPDDLAW